MVSMHASSAVDRGFEPWLGQTKDYKIGICCFSAKLVFAASPLNLVFVASPLNWYLLLLR